MPRAPVVDSPERIAAVECLRGLVLGWPGVVESASYGNPAFKAGKKPFVILDRYKGSDCLWLLCPKAEREAVLALEGFFPSPYDPKGAAVCCALDGLDWAVVEPLLHGAYEAAAL